MKVKLTTEEIARLKGQGFILQRDQQYFVCRVITVDGNLNEKEAKKVADIAKKYGKGYMSFTMRLTVEIPGIEYENIEKVKEELKEVGLYSGGTGARVRPIVACKGTVCKFGLLDTQNLSRKIHERFYLGWYDVALPHKFKICVGGCPNNCAKPDLNDIGIMGQKKPQVDLDLCRGCKKCNVESVCRVGAAKVVDGKIKIDADKCIHCGLCIDACHFNAFQIGQEGVKIFIGGMWGKEPHIGESFDKIFTEEEAMDMIEKIILYYKEKGMHKERFGKMVQRIGFEKVEKDLLQDQ
ncbi:4Fe-4S binding protein [Inediibacterium massiliense]|uniref:4Fe-4S binding protein n=1 Tax=Inediibacterium massiliense TaxID=1658111 RepID=UPI0006B42A1D|nr:4Fe-4S binding protein [Inediibacterium massiliense]